MTLNYTEEDITVINPHLWHLIKIVFAITNKNNHGDKLKNDSYKNKNQVYPTFTLREAIRDRFFQTFQNEIVTKRLFNFYLSICFTASFLTRLVIAASILLSSSSAIESLNFL